MRPSLLLAFFLAAPFPTHAQWQLQEAHTTADLRGIDSVGNGVAWASGTNGTVLRTEDGGTVWQPCAVPAEAEHLDFRGIQALNSSTAVVMSSGKGDLSRIYKTTDGCKTWKLVFNNPDDAGFFDSIRRPTAQQLFVAGDPVGGKFAIFTSRDAGDTWFIEDDPGLDAAPTAGAFAASNSALSTIGPFMFLATGGPEATVYHSFSDCNKQTNVCSMAWKAAVVPLAHGQPDAGAFSTASRFAADAAGKLTAIVLTVGGAYKQPDASTGTAAWSRDGGATWTAATTPPHGYRSAVAYDKAHNTWITVGPNGTDSSTDDGRNWRPLKPGSSDPPDADQHWNALSLPFVVGPHGRIATLRPDALPLKR